MAKRPLATFERVEEPIEAIRQCMGLPADLDTLPRIVWHYGFLARDTVVYTSGRIAREGDSVRHKVDPDELALCRTLSEATRKIDPPYYPGSDGDFQWGDFYIAANVDDPAPERIDESLIRERFGGTILPMAPIAIEPIEEESEWWIRTTESIYYGCSRIAENAKVEHDVWWERSMAVARALNDRNLKIYGDKRENATEVRRIVESLNPGHDYNSRARQRATASEILTLFHLIRFYKRPEFQDAAYVTIGVWSEWRFRKDEWPPGLESWPSSMPCLVLGLTRGGSLTGLMGYTVQT
jgi:hypothetical protein